MVGTVGIYRTATQRNAKLEVVRLKVVTRLVVYGGAKSSSDNSAFFHASKNVIKDYKNDLPVKSVFMKNGIKDLLDTINSQPENSVQSLDIFVHGSEYSLYTIIGSSLEKNNKKKDVNSMNLESNIYINLGSKWNWWEPRGDGDWKNLYTLSDINYKVFTKESKIEIHGCHTAFDGANNTLCAALSKHLYNAGKTRSVVIGHTDYANPNRGGTKEISKQDYRHEERAIYNNGRLIAKTRLEGRIPPSFIKSKLGG